ncbi:glycosyltransferase family 4 protein [Cytobacillus solani]|uniref:glycosyltransferase family 4 protein n=1 Tax=Cytobacillus solani TaxID=1637975 RepID=UPI003D9EAA4B
MKVLMICTEKLPVPPIMGGAIQTYISGILPYLSKVHDISVLGVNDASLPNQETVDGIHYVRVPGKIFEVYRKEVIRYLESNHFDLIHIFNRPLLVMPVRQASPNSIITLSMHNDMFNPEKINPEEAKSALNEVSKIVTVSEYIGDVIRTLYPEASPKISTIYSGVDSSRFLPGNHPKMQKTRNDIRKAHGLENKTVILFAGRLSNNKGVDRLIRAIPNLSRKFNDLALVIVGSKWFSQDDISDYIAYVKSLAKKLPIPVVTTGFVAPDEIQNWFAAADIFVCTSIWQEPLARVHYEAMAAGLPIVTTARGGNPEVILSGENGLVVENPEDPGCFEEKIAEILSNKSLMRRMGERGRELAVSIYKYDRVASEVLEIWEQSMQMPAVHVLQEEAVKTAEVPAMFEMQNKFENQGEQEIDNDKIVSFLDSKPEIVMPSESADKQPAVPHGKLNDQPHSIYDEKNAEILLYKLLMRRLGKEEKDLATEVPEIRKQLIQLLSNNVPQEDTDKTAEVPIMNEVQNTFENQEDQKIDKGNLDSWQDSKSESKKPIASTGKQSDAPQTKLNNKLHSIFGGKIMDILTNEPLMKRVGEKGRVIASEVLEIWEEFLQTISNYVVQENTDKTSEAPNMNNTQNNVENQKEQEIEIPSEYSNKQSKVPQTNLHNKLHTKSHITSQKQGFSKKDRYQGDNSYSVMKGRYRDEESYSVMRGRYIDADKHHGKDK